jgi:hypothetical protein
MRTNRKERAPTNGRYKRGGNQDATIAEKGARLRDDLGVSIIYIPHHLATASSMSDRIKTMQNGKAVERAWHERLDYGRHSCSILKPSVLTPDAGP